MEESAFDPLAHLLGEDKPKSILSLPTSIREQGFQYLAPIYDYTVKRNRLSARDKSDSGGYLFNRAAHRYHSPGRTRKRFRHLPKQVYPENGLFCPDCQCR